MENIATSLKVRCAKVGTTLKEVCDRAGVSPATIHNWRKNEPHSLRIYRGLSAAIEDIEKEKAALNDNTAPISE
jgi:transcriptional regulator with XRE-family HTH domain